MVGPGVATVEGNVYKHQRRIISPAFGPVQIKEITDIFIGKSVDLEAILSSQIMSPGGKLHTDMFMWLSKTTLEIIGLAGFGRKLDALSDSDLKPHELTEAFLIMMKAASTPLMMLQAAIPL